MQRVELTLKNGGKLDFALPYYARNFHQDRKLSDLSDCRYFFIDRKLKANKKEMEDDLKYSFNNGIESLKKKRETKPHI